MTEWHDMTAVALGAAIGAGRLDPLDLAEHFLARCATQDRERAIYLRLTEARARAEAKAARERAKAGLRRHALDGVPISWKDLYDSAGSVTTFGSRLLSGPPAARDALVLERATRAGLVCLGKTNLTEFAFSGLGINTVFGTPSNPCDAKTPRCPGGSSSGAAASVVRGLAAAGIGSDTGGSVRVPAAWQGLVGLKTTAGLLPLDGALPLSTSYDTIGPLCRDIADAAALFGVLTEKAAPDLAGTTLAGLPFLVAEGLMTRDLEPGVGAAFEAAIDRLARAGARIVRAEVPEFAEVVSSATYKGNPVNVEGYALWGDLIEGRPGVAYHQVADRLRLGADVKATDYYATLQRIEAIKPAYLTRTAGYAAVLAPTVPIIAPPIAPLVDDKDAYAKANMAALRNTRPGNLLGLSALTLPCGTSEGMPVGLMLYGEPGAEARLLRLGKAVEDTLAA
ncbi:MAG: amidase [Alphaproteobacteria bacterium]|nr:amidase [Alphaproteobacteria bacterium]